MKYDFLVVGAGLFGAVFAYEAKKAGKTCLVIDRRGHIGGNIYTENIEGIPVHRYGAHIFHTDNQYIWDYVQQFATFNRFTNSPIARYKDEVYNLPFNMNTFNKLWGVVTPQQAKEKIRSQQGEFTGEAQNLEQQAISLVGRDIYEKLVKGYTEKQWGKRADELPAFIIRRLPVRFTYDNNYFADRYQGIPEGGYTQIVEKMLSGIEVRLDTDYLKNRAYFDTLADQIIFTGMIDAFYDYRFGPLSYRSLRFETQVLNTDNFQGNAVVNYTEYEVPFTRIIEHKHFAGIKTDKTVITKEYPKEWKPGDEPYYPVNDAKNNALYEKYRQLSLKEKNIKFGGRLGAYRYYDMHQVIEAALQLKKEVLKV